MNKNKELAKNTAIITIGKICTQFLSFFLMPLYTKVLSKEEYGTVDLVVTYTSLFMPLVLFQADQALFRFLIDVRKNNDGKRRIITTAAAFAVVQSIAVVLMFCVIQVFISTKYKWYLLINILACICSNMTLQTARGLGNNTDYALGSFLSAALQIVGNVLLLTVFHMGVYGMLVATISAQFIAAGFLFFKEKIYSYFSPADFNIDTLKDILKYSVPLIPNALCWWAINASDRTIVLAFLGTAYTGLLAAGHKFSSVYITFYNIFNLSWTESAALHMNDDDKDEFFSGVITNMFKLFMCAATGIVACLPFVFNIIINKKFNGAYNIVPIFMLASTLNVVVGLYSVVYVALKKTKEITKTSLYSGIINILTHLLLVKFIGLYAAAVSSALAFGVMAVYRYFDIKKYITVKLPIKWIVITSLMYLTACLSYYCENKLLQFAALIILAAMCVVINKSMLVVGINFVKKKFGIGKLG